MVVAAASVDIRDFGPSLTEEQARQIFRQGEEGVVFALSQLAKQLQQAQAGTALGPSTPSGMKPVYQKPPASTRRKKPGRKPGQTQGPLYPLGLPSEKRQVVFVLD